MSCNHHVTHVLNRNPYISCKRHPLLVVANKILEHCIFLQKYIHNISTYSSSRWHNELQDNYSADMPKSFVIYKTKRLLTHNNRFSYCPSTRILTPSFSQNQINCIFFAARTRPNSSEMSCMIHMSLYAFSYL